ncbi:MAG: Crp/Fnr family transcriptional regulator, partial [Alphaproteobacteria bacterium]|nr:Crp/Fnr family transcriptional regulator [Alphaproteobacteria bacterium]
PECEALEAACATPVSFRAGKEVVAASASLDEPWFVLEGWLCRQITLPDGRRQILDFAIPGDLVGYSSRSGARAAASSVCLTDAVLAEAKDVVSRVETLPGLLAALRATEHESEAGLIAQLARNGRMPAHERMVHLLNELAARHQRAELGSAAGFEMPLTQECLGDALGLSTVHVNRVLQQLRRSGAIRTSGGKFAILAPESSSAGTAGKVEAASVSVES